MTLSDFKNTPAGRLPQNQHLWQDVNGKKAAKYKNSKIIQDGEVFDSKKELCRWNDLRFLQSIGEISGLERQVTYQLSVCKYIADAVYTAKDGMKIVEDTKSPITRKLPVFRLKKKLMLAEHGINIKEV